MADNENETIHCPIGKWYFKRMTLLGLLLLGFGGYFLYDGAIGYPKGAVKGVAFEAFKSGKVESWEEYTTREGTNFSEATLDDEAIATVKAAHAAGAQKTTWGDFATKRKFDTAEPAPGAPQYELYQAFKAGGVDGADWINYATTNSLPEDPSAVANRDERIDALFSAFEEAGKAREWSLYASTNDLPSKEPHFHGKSDIIEQYVFGGLCTVIGLVVLGLMLLNRGREVRADTEAYYPKPGTKVAYADVFKIDKRKWRRKGLAYAFYKEGGADKKAVIDDLKFAGSQAILDRMEANFNGELVEEIVDDEIDDDPATGEKEGGKASSEST